MPGDGELAMCWRCCLSARGESVTRVNQRRRDNDSEWRAGLTNVGRATAGGAPDARFASASASLFLASPMSRNRSF